MGAQRGRPYAPAPCGRPGSRARPRAPRGSPIARHRARRSVENPAQTRPWPWPSGGNRRRRRTRGVPPRPRLRARASLVRWSSIGPEVRTSSSARVSTPTARRSRESVGVAHDGSHVGLQGPLRRGASRAAQLDFDAFGHAGVEREIGLDTLAKRRGVRKFKDASLLESLRGGLDAAGVEEQPGVEPLPLRVLRLAHRSRSVLGGDRDLRCKARRGEFLGEKPAGPAEHRHGDQEPGEGPRRLERRPLLG
jgi:hypothetical protein